MDKNKLILPISILLGSIILGCFYYASQTKVPTGDFVDFSTQEDDDGEEEVKNSINVEKILYISCSNGRCLIPKSSGLPMDDGLVCLWNYTCGNGSIPWIWETTGWLPSINYSSSCQDLSVLCRDSNGIIYFGEEGEER